MARIVLICSSSLAKQRIHTCALTYIQQKVIFMIIVTLHLKVAPEKRVNALEVIHSMIGPTSVQPGCLNCNFYSSTRNDDELILMQKWESHEKLERHIRSDEFRKILAAMETAKEAPRLCFSEVASTEGMALVEKILG